MVHFVGAGSGAVDLITVRGMRLLEKADVVIYAGSLVNPDLLTYTKEECKKYNSATMTLEEIINVMVENRDKEIVRLHTGEPSLYGAVQEQMDALLEYEIAFDSCPGVTACFGAASSLDLEFTLPDVAQTLIITRMEGKTKVPESEQIEKLASHQTSMAIYLSSGMLDELSQRLQKGGYSKDTPVALVYKATWPEEKAIVTTLDKLPKEAKENHISKTAVVLVGDAIAKSGYSKSRLYAADFETEFRGKKI